MRKHYIIILCLIAAGCGNISNKQICWDRGQWLDLTWDFEKSTVYWPTNVTFIHDTVTFGINDKGYFYSSFLYAAEEHGGTHFDAPLHFAENGRSIEQILPKNLRRRYMCRCIRQGFG